MNGDLNILYLRLMLKINMRIMLRNNDGFVGQQSENSDIYMIATL